MEKTFKEWEEYYKDYSAIELIKELSATDDDNYYGYTKCCWLMSEIDKRGE